ncbi:hypothetical protein [Actinoplanes palleronii]|uniref:Ig-like domain-containing protein n=1 Tax=Actinoplanes palleronii TaxID=113570 RepID=A0ABQ4BEJ4_9ACTN|nr:hypothetical protein [Actinoplanes palleronii]GIE69111.1 hypothetical protein Apa02nite_052190 [Actinoplanes palleronii]
MGEPETCDALRGAEHHTWTITTTLPNERVLTQFNAVGDSAQAILHTPDGSCSLGPYPGECTVEQPGTYQVDVYLYYREGEASYGIGVESRDAPSSCTTLDPATFTVHGAALSRSAARGSAGDCYRFEGQAGMRLTVETSGTTTAPGYSADIRGTLLDPSGEQVCPIQFGGGDCTLTANGTHSFFLTDDYGSAVDYTLRLIRTDQPIGCGALVEGAFGPLSAGQVVAGELGTAEFTCYSVHLTAGTKSVRTVDGGQIDWELSNAAGRICSEYDHLSCEVPATGDYTLWLRHPDWTGNPTSFRASIVDVAGDVGCAPVVGIGWDQPVVTFTPTSPVEVFCQPFAAQPGERVIVYASGGGVTRITDSSGTSICSEYESDQDGCVLPGSGPYRVITEADDTDPVTLQIRSLSAATGCPEITPGAYGTGPAGALGGIRCRTLDVPAAGRYLVRVVDDENYETWSQVYTPDGKRLCQAGYLCPFPAAGKYTLVVGGGNSGVRDGSYATVFTAPNGPGCVPVTEQGLATGAIRGSFGIAGETDCLQLSSPAGAKISVLTPSRATGAARPDWTLINAAGDDLCSTNNCVLTGAAPYRLLLNAPEDSAPGDYAVVVQRLDQITGCGTLPAGLIGKPAGLTTTFSSTKFATCWTIPGTQHTASEIVSFASVSGTGYAVLTVKDSLTGAEVCGSYSTSAIVLRCKFQTGKAYVAVLTAAAENAQYRVARRDATGTNCQTPANTVLGGSAATGTLTALDDVRCYRVTAAASSNYWLGVRSTDYDARYWITDAAGTDRCAGYVVPCRVSGATSYLLFVRSATAGAVPYAVDTWNLGTADKPAAQCPAVTGVPGFSRAGTLDAAHTAICVAVPVINGRSDFRAVITNPAGGEALPEPYYFSTLGTGTGIVRCSWASGGRGCDAYVSYPAPKSSTALFVLAPEQASGTFPYRVGTICDSDPCKVTSSTPASASNLGPVTLTLRGEALAAGDRVQLNHAGSASITAAVQSVSDGVLTATANLTGVAPGVWDIAVSSDTDWRQGTLYGGLTVTTTTLKLVKAPVISGTVRVGATVRAVAGSWTPAATGYAYQWAANGAAIKGATGSSYVIPGSLRGKRITVTVTAKRANRLNSPAVSAGGTVGWGVAPKATTSPKIAGTVKAGRKVKVAVGTWSPRADSYRYEWRVGGKLVATGSTLTLKKSWGGKKVTVTVIAKRTGCYDGRRTSGSVKIKR